MYMIMARKMTIEFLGTEIGLVSGSGRFFRFTQAINRQNISLVYCSIRNISNDK